MANEAQELLRAAGGLSGNTGPAADLMLAIARTVDGGFTDGRYAIMEKFRASGIPLSSPLGQWVWRMAQEVEQGGPFTPAAAMAFSRPIAAQDQKPLGGSREGIEEDNILLSNFI